VQEVGAVMSFNQRFWSAVAAVTLAAVCGGLWVDWKLNWGRKKAPRGFEVIQRGPVDGEGGQ